MRSAKDDDLWSGKTEQKYGGEVCEQSSEMGAVGQIGQRAEIWRRSVYQSSEMDAMGRGSIISGQVRRSNTGEIDRYVVYV